MRLWPVLILVVLVAGCGGGGDETPPPPSGVTGGNTDGGSDSSGGSGSGGGDSGGDTGSGDNTSGDGPAALNTKPSSYRWTTLAVGTRVYVDREYEYTDVGAALVGLPVLQTENDDKGTTASGSVEFELAEPAVVYVGHVHSSGAQPDWLDTWTYTGETLGTDDRTLHLYRQSFPAGPVALDGNGGAQSMYVVILASDVVDSGGDGGSGGGGDSGGGDGGSGGDAGTDHSPIASNDSASTVMNTAVAIDVLANDAGIDDTPLSVTVLQNPDSGSVTVGSDQRITYTPQDSFVGSDSFTYRVTDTDGDQATGTVTVQVTCEECAAGVTLTLSWNASSEAITGYSVFHGPTADTATVKLADIPLTAEGFDPQSPSVSYDAWNHLGLSIGDNICFRLKSYNSAGASDFSSAVCGSL